MVKSDVKSILVKPVLVKTVTLDRFEDSAGNTITQINEGATFYAVGYYKQDSTPIGSALIWVYRTNSAGTPVTPYERNSGYTDSTGKYRISFVAIDVTVDTAVYFSAYDDAQKPT
jgi:hypothetical protein